ncbi:hypothetical protein BN1303_00180 [Mycobacterium tuberculosis]|nr:hypothetical protein BN1303_00180 [Mycobacterium tuberculosis]
MPAWNGSKSHRRDPEAGGLARYGSPFVPLKPNSNPPLPPAPATLPPEMTISALPPLPPLPISPAFPPLPPSPPLPPGVLEVREQPSDWDQREKNHHGHDVDRDVALGLANRLPSASGSS